MNPVQRKFGIGLGVALGGFLIALALDQHPFAWSDVLFASIAAVATAGLLVLPYHRGG
ncbi:MAG: hypothetical protein HKN01_03560 [Acidimicrobiia bacterium]|nr:hypothetical protein [Acidimicrobiia bacterium]NNF68824.1 hypothetical protein [Acidimicrobiia bacterium]